MRLRSIALSTAFCLAPAIFLYPAMQAFGSPSIVATSAPDDASGGSTFNVAEKTQIPGATLKPGNYTIRVVDRLSDRTILSVQDDKGKTISTFLALPGAGLGKPAAGAIPYDSPEKGKNALRGFAFANGPALEFVYPKAEAVVLAKTYGNKVPAIDPQSEGRVAAPSLSKGDLEVVTLWMLSTTVVGTDSKHPAIQAERYQTAVATVAPPPPTPKATQQIAALQPPASVQPERTQQVAAVHPPRPNIKALPHTASELPLFAVFGLLCFAGALGLTTRRVTIGD